MPEGSDVNLLFASPRATSEVNPLNAPLLIVVITFSLRSLCACYNMTLIERCSHTYSILSLESPLNAEVSTLMIMLLVRRLNRRVSVQTRHSICSRARVHFLETCIFQERVCSDSGDVVVLEVAEGRVKSLTLSHRWIGTYRAVMPLGSPVQLAEVIP